MEASARRVNDAVNEAVAPVTDLPIADEQTTHVDQDDSVVITLTGSDLEITIFDSTGLAIQDVALAQVVYKAAQEQGIGRTIDFFA